VSTGAIDALPRRVTLMQALMVPLARPLALANPRPGASQEEKKKIARDNNDNVEIVFLLRLDNVDKSTVSGVTFVL
jgi:hypothetical protein